MSFMIFDDTGNALDAFDDYASARSCFEQLVREDPSMVRSLVLLAFDDAGNAIGEPEVAADMAAVADLAVRVVLTAPAAWFQIGARTFVERWLGGEIRSGSANGAAPGLAVA
jgi:hypothetical protein